MTTPTPATETVTLLALPSLPESLDLAAIADRACNAAFRSIADDLEAETGAHTFGDFDPAETVALDRIFALFVRAMAVNNPALLAPPARSRLAGAGQNDEAGTDSAC